MAIVSRLALFSGGEAGVRGQAVRRADERAPAGHPAVLLDQEHARLCDPPGENFRFFMQNGADSIVFYGKMV